LSNPEVAGTIAAVTVERTFSHFEIGPQGIGRRPTMREVAALAGVSLSTVSRVVNGDGRVDDRLAEQVRHAVEMLGYRQNVTASSLRRSDHLSASIGLILEDVSNPFFSLLHRGVEEVARERGVLTFAGSSDERPDRERELAGAFAARGADGLVIAPASGDHGFLERDRAGGMGVVFVDRPSPSLHADRVLSDNRGGAEAAVAHLIAHGHRRIAFLGDRPELFTAAQRFAGYRDALAAAGIPVTQRLVVHLHSLDGQPGAAVHELLSRDDPPTALFSSQNLITIGALRQIHALGLQHRVALVGFDDISLADVVEPAVTVVAQDPAAMGRKAAELLFRRIDGDGGAPSGIRRPRRWSG
jgi:LacI family transcriptional regulator